MTLSGLISAMEEQNVRVKGTEVQVNSIMASIGKLVDVISKIQKETDKWRNLLVYFIVMDINVKSRLLNLDLIYVLR